LVETEHKETDVNEEGTEQEEVAELEEVGPQEPEAVPDTTVEREALERTYQVNSGSGTTQEVDEVRMENTSLFIRYC